MICSWICDYLKAFFSSFLSDKTRIHVSHVMITFDVFMIINFSLFYEFSFCWLSLYILSITQALKIFHTFSYFLVFYHVYLYFFHSIRSYYTLSENIQHSRNISITKLIFRSHIFSDASCYYKNGKYFTLCVVCRMHKFCATKLQRYRIYVLGVNIGVWNFGSCEWFNIAAFLNEIFFFVWINDTIVQL